MEVELPSMPVSIRQTYQGRLATSRQALEKVKKSLVCALFGRASIFDASQKDTRQENQRNELFAGFPDGDDPYTDDPSGFGSRTRLLQGTDRLADGSKRLDNAHRIALETEDVGADILRNLRGQREQIEHTRDSVSLSEHPVDSS